MTGKYRTLADINRIVADDIREGVSLEYKGSPVVSSNSVGAICKAVSALANSAGGQFVVGIESKDGRPTRLDGGILGQSKLDWFHQIINSNTHPAIENFEVFEIADGDSHYYVVDVPVSAQAPHQSNDNRYYKRRGPHSDPMEHYEVEDIRNRPKLESSPLRVEIFSDSFLALLRFSNDDGSNAITNLKLEISTNFDLKINSLKELNSRVLRRLAPSGKLFFHLDTFASILSSNSEAEISVTADYQFKGGSMRQSVRLYVGDFDGSAIIQTPLERAAKNVSDKIEKLAGSLAPLKNLLEVFERAVDGSGLRVSKRTISALRGEHELHNPAEFDHHGYQIVANLSLDDAFELYSVLRWRNYPNSRAKEKYLDLPEELRNKFEKFFTVDFNQD